MLNGTKYTCTLCGRTTSLDTGYKYIVSVVQTGGHGRCSHAKTLVVCQHCIRSHKTVLNLQRKSLDEENTLEFHKLPKTSKTSTKKKLEKKG